jgi:hypothetical protein
VAVDWIEGVDMAAPTSSRPAGRRGGNDVGLPALVVLRRSAQTRTDKSVMQSKWWNADGGSKMLGGLQDVWPEPLEMANSSDRDQVDWGGDGGKSQSTAV